MGNTMFWAALSGSNAGIANENAERARKWRDYAKELEVDMKALEVEMLNLREEHAEALADNMTRHQILQNLLPDYKAKFPGGGKAVEKMKRDYEQQYRKELGL